MATDSTRKDNKNTRKKDWLPVGYEIAQIADSSENK